MNIKTIVKVLAAAILTAIFAGCASASVTMTEEEAKALERITEFAYCDHIGDVDRNGQLEPADARLILRASVSLERLDSDQRVRSDMDADGEITSFDARSALRCAIGADQRPPHTKETVVVKAPTCNEEGYTVIYCLTCHKLYAGQTTAPTDHSAGVWEVVKSATCQEDGLSELKCINCGKVIKTDVLPKGEHVYGEWIYPNGKSCLQSVSRYRECDVCGARQNDTVPAAGEHSFQWVTTKEPTCLEDGEESFMCVNCDTVSRTKAIPSPGEHEADEWIVTKTQTCTEDGVREKNCIRCGISLAKETIPARGHDFRNGQYKVLLAPTCQTEGKARGVCSVCGEQQEILLEKTDHDYKTGPIVVREASCSQDGIIEAECRYCGEIRELIPALGHDITEHITEATCAAEGEIVSVCSRCGATVERKSLPKASHSYGKEIVIVKEPTCIESGSCYVTCSVCKDKLLRELPPTGKHTAGNETRVTREASCTEDQYIISVCIYCGSDIPETEKPKQGTALGHDFQTWKTITPATCVVAGQKSSVCSRCGAEGLLEIDPMGHKSTGAWVTAEAATCRKEGLEVIRCEFCGDAVETRSIPKTAHTPVTKIMTTATCTAEGRETVQCSVCGELLENHVIPKTAHDPVYTITKQPTCAEEGETTASCSVCGQTLGKSPVPKAQHQPVVVTETLPTCQTTGLNVEKCSVCGAVLREMEIPKTGHRYVPDEIIQPAAASTFRWDGKQGTMYGWQGSRCAYCGDLKDNVRYVRMIIKGDFEPVFETGTNPDAGRFVFRLKDPDASSRTEKVVYSIGSDVQTTAVIPTNGVYSFTVPASVSRTDTINIFIVSKS